MDIQETRSHGRHLAFAAAFRTLASKVAELANPSNPSEWFTALGQHTFEYVDHTTHPQFDEQEMREIKEATYVTLRMLFDPKGFEI